MFEFFKSIQDDVDFRFWIFIFGIDYGKVSVAHREFDRRLQNLVGSWSLTLADSSARWLPIRHPETRKSLLLATHKHSFNRRTRSIFSLPDSRLFDAVFLLAPALYSGCIQGRECNNNVASASQRARTPDSFSHPHPGRQGSIPER